MTGRILRVWDMLLDVAKGVAACIVLAITFGVCADVVLRRWGTGGLPWMFDFVEYGLLAITALATAHVLREGQHVRIDLVVGALPSGAQYAAWIIGKVLILGFSAALTYYALRATIQAYGSGAIIYRFILVPEWIPYALVTMLFLFVSLEGIRQIAVALRSGGPRERDRSDMF